MTEPIDSFEHAGLTIELHYDDDRGDTPRDWSNVGKMFVDYRDYNLGDKDAVDPRDRTLPCPHCDGTGESPDRFDLISTAPGGYLPMVVGSGTRESMEGEAERMNERREPQARLYRAQHADCPSCEGGEVPASMADYLRVEEGARVIIPLYVYDHSQITMWSGKPILTAQQVKRSDLDPRGRNPFDTAAWDTSMVGFTYDTPEGVKQCMGDATDEEIVKALEQEVTVYDQYLQGQVYGYTILDEDGDILDSCWGFYEEDGVWPDSEKSYTRREAMGVAEGIRTELDAKHAKESTEAAFWAARDTITVGAA